MLRAQKTGLEGRVGRTNGVKGQKHKEQLPGVDLGWNSHQHLSTTHSQTQRPHLPLRSELGPSPMCVLTGPHWGLGGAG